MPSTKQKLILALLAVAIVGVVTALIVMGGRGPRPAKTPQEAAKNAIANAAPKDAAGNTIMYDRNVQEYLLSRTDAYTIVYQKSYDHYVISILAMPFETSRESAETEFLALTRASQELACKLQVAIVVPLYINPELAGEEFPLSFCSQ